MTGYYKIAVNNFMGQGEIDLWIDDYSEGYAISIPLCQSGNNYYSFVELEEGQDYYICVSNKSEKEGYSGNIEINPITRGIQVEGKVYSGDLSNVCDYEFGIGERDVSIGSFAQIYQLKEVAVGQFDWVDVTNQVDFTVVWKEYDEFKEEYVVIGEGVALDIPEVRANSKTYYLQIEMEGQVKSKTTINVSSNYFVSCDGTTDIMDPAEGDLQISLDGWDPSPIGAMAGDKVEVDIADVAVIKTFCEDEYSWEEYDEKLISPRTEDEHYSFEFKWHRGENVYEANEEEPYVCNLTVDEEAYGSNPYYCQMKILKDGKELLTYEIPITFTKQVTINTDKTYDAYCTQKGVDVLIGKPITSSLDRAQLSYRWYRVDEVLEDGEIVDYNEVLLEEFNDSHNINVSPEETTAYICKITATDPLGEYAAGEYEITYDVITYENSTSLRDPLEIKGEERQVFTFDVPQTGKYALRVQMSSVTHAMVGVYGPDGIVREEIIVANLDGNTIDETLPLVKEFTRFEKYTIIVSNYDEDHSSQTLKLTMVQVNEDCQHENMSQWSSNVPATCVTGTTETRHCTDCGENREERTVDPLGHKLSAWKIESSATTEREGVKYKECLNCGQVMETEVIPMVVLKTPQSATARLTPYFGKAGAYNDVKVSWSKVSGASGYNVYYKKASATRYTKLASTTNAYIYKKDLASGVKYSFKIVPYVKAGGQNWEGKEAKVVSITTLKKLAAPTVTAKSGKVKVKWTNIAGETGYQISKSPKKTGTKIVATYKTTKGTYKLLSATKGKTYYYKVRAYKVVNGVKIYAPWSKVKAYKR